MKHHIYYIDIYIYMYIIYVRPRIYNTSANLQETLGMRVVAASMAHADKAPLDTLGIVCILCVLRRTIRTV